MKHVKFIALLVCLFAIVLTATACENEKAEVLTVETLEDYWRTVHELSLKEEKIANAILAEGKVSTANLNQMRAVAELQSQLYHLAEENDFFNDQIIEWVLDGAPRHLAYVNVQMSPLHEGEEERCLSYLNTPISWGGSYYPESRVLNLGTGAFSAMFLENAEGPQIEASIEVMESSVYDTEKTYVLGESGDAFLLFYGMETGYSLLHFEEADSTLFESEKTVFDAIESFVRSAFEAIDNFIGSVANSITVTAVCGLIGAVGVSFLVILKYMEGTITKVKFAVVLTFCVISIVFFLGFTWCAFSIA